MTYVLRQTSETRPLCSWAAGARGDCGLTRCASLARPRCDNRFCVLTRHRHKGPGGRPYGPYAWVHKLEPRLFPVAASPRRSGSPPWGWAGSYTRRSRSFGDVRVRPAPEHSRLPETRTEHTHPGSMRLLRVRSHLRCPESRVSVRVRFRGYLPSTGRG